MTAEKSAADAVRQQILTHVRRALEKMPDERVAAVTDPVALGQLMAEVIPPAAGEMSRLIGPVYAVSALTELWGTTPNEVSASAADGRLLVLLAEGEPLFPVFQFDGAQIRSDVMSLVRTLRPHVDAATISQWFNTPVPDDPAERTPLAMRSDGDDAAAARCAAAAAGRWAA
ncbi:hypothetical protein [Brevibacterium otitidis]|uniref:SseB protein N-terminal domain-containing protein n=1 Tax=Brevibacterium otitidis TaxID=53364 RepID=A0ABV5X5B3_9MICO|nr:hypothetical protein GCM10023233_03470 [Brevibacterium otitidis]